MNKNILSLFCFLFFSINLYAQNDVMDSLKNELSLHQEKNTARVNLLNEIAFLFCRKNLDTTLVYVNESSEIAKAIDYQKGNAKSLYLKGLSEAVHSHYVKGFEYYKEAIQLYKTINAKRDFAECYKEMGIFFYKNGNQKEAIKYYEKSLKINEELDDKEEMFINLNNIGWSYLQIGYYPKAIAAYKKALEINEETKNKTLLTYCLSDLGAIYTYQGNYPLALEYFNKALVIGKESGDSISMGNTLGNMGPVYNHLENYDKAIECYKESIVLLENTNKEAVASNLNNLGLTYKDQKKYDLAYEHYVGAQKAYNEINNKTNEGLCLNNIGDLYLEQKKYKAAYQYFEQAKKINLEIKNQRGLCVSYLGIARVLNNQKKYDKALDNALKSKLIADELEILLSQRDVNELLSKVYKNTNKYKKAFASHQEFKILNDTLFSKENIEKIARLENEYKYQQALDSANIRELELTKTVETTSQNLEKSQRNYLLAIIGFLLISMLLGFIIFYQKFKNIKSKNQNIVTEQKLLRSQMTPHFIFNSLSVLQGMILNKEYKKSISYLSKFSKLLRIILENSRDQMVVLAQELIAIEHYLALHNLENEAYQYSVSVNDKIDKSLFKIPPMLIQPFVENAIEHAFKNQKGKREIDVFLKYEDEKLICTITDNGIGINFQEEKKSKQKKSLATTITSERLKILSKDFKMKGSVNIEDRKKYNQKGTIVTLVIPYQTPPK